MTPETKAFVEACEQWAADEDYSDESIAGFAERDVPGLCRIIRKQAAEIDGEREARLGAQDELDEVCRILGIGEDVSAIESAQIMRDRCERLVNSVRARFDNKAMSLEHDDSDESRARLVELDENVRTALAFFEDDDEP